ncbi:hypothetical protein MSHRCOH1_04550 [Candidatus Ornithobacterium hominis]|nr:hypothetical protein MSHRCOH1_04550 [Candidatus Ornithobacterium hominis]
MGKMFYAEIKMKRYYNSVRIYNLLEKILEK